MVLNILLTFIVITIIGLYFVVRKTYSYWDKFGIPCIRPIVFPYGSVKNLTKQHHVSIRFLEFYKKYKSQTPFVGLYFLLKPVALITDLRLVKAIMSTDFINFHDRQFYYNAENDPLSAHLFAVGGHRWKKLRSTMTPVFTSGKMKFMFPKVLEIGDRLTRCIDGMIVESEKLGKPVDIEIKNLWIRYSMDIIGTSAFGIDCNAIADENNEIIKMGIIPFTKPLRTISAQLLVNQYRSVAQKLGLKQFRQEMTDFFLNIFQQTLAYREKSNEQKRDFVNLLLEQKKNQNLGNDEIFVQLFIFLIAGFETTASTLSFCSFELAKQPEIQEKLRKEIKEVLQKYEGQFSYESISEMTYLDKVINETLRKYPVVPYVTRDTHADYKVPDYSYVIPKGCLVILPIYPIHHDADIYPDPDKFNPERFSPEEMAKRDPSAYFPFGDGPRTCVGMRFAMMEMKIALVKLMVGNFKFSLSSKMPNSITFGRTHFLLASENGVHIVIEKLKS